jgi:hypothetical protein
MAGSWMDEYEVAPTGQGGAPEAWTERYSVAPTAVKAKRAAPYEAEGAPYTVRGVVGSARDPDKLATLKRYYPDAEQTDDGNFIFTDPTNKKRTLYNPKGLDLGDFASLVRQYAETIGGTVGGGAGFVAGGIGGALLGAGAGQAVAGKAVDVGRTAAGLPQTYSPADTTSDIKWGMAGEGTGRLLPEFGRIAARGLRRPSTQVTPTRTVPTGEIVRATQRLSAGRPPEEAIPLTGSMTERMIPAAGEHTAAGLLPFSKPSNTAEMLFENAQKRLADARPPGGAPGATVKEGVREAGGALKAGAEAADAAYDALRLKADEAFYNALPQGTKFRLPRFQKEVAALRAQFAARPSLAKDMPGVLSRIEQIEADLAAGGGALDPRTLRHHKTELFKQRTPPLGTAITDADQRTMAKIYNTLDEDLQAAAKTANPRAQQLYQRHNRLVKAYRQAPSGTEPIAKSLDAIIKAGSDEAAWTALHAQQGGAKRMQQVVKRLSPGQRQAVARATWDRMMDTGQGNAADPSRWATKWLNMGQAEKNLLFAGVTDVGALDDLATVLRAQVAGGVGRNTSRTAETTAKIDMVWKALQMAAAAAAGTGAAMTGDVLTPALSLGGAYALSHAFYHPATIRQIIRTAANTGRAAGPVPRAVGAAAASLARAAMSGPPPAIPPPERRDLLGGS